MLARDDYCAPRATGFVAAAAIAAAVAAATPTEMSALLGETVVSGPSARTASSLSHVVDIVPAAWHMRTPRNGIFGISDLLRFSSTAARQVKEKRQIL